MVPPNIFCWMICVGNELEGILEKCECVSRIF